MEVSLSSNLWCVLVKPFRLMPSPCGCVCLFGGLFGGLFGSDCGPPGSNQKYPKLTVAQAKADCCALGDDCVGFDWVRKDRGTPACACACLHGVCGGVCVGGGTRVCNRLRVYAGDKERQGGREAGR